MSEEPLRLSLDVGCPRGAAFDVFARRTSLWWPPGHTATGAAGSTVTFEPFAGGRIYERTSAGEEIEWGRILAFEPPSRLAYTWHLRTDRADATEVEVRFVEAGDRRCRVEIEHRGWERLGARAPEWRDANRRGWGRLLPHFAAACAAEA